MRTLIFLCSFLAMQSAIAQQRSYDFTKLDTYFNTLDAHDKFMGTVAVMIDGEDVYSRAIGCADCAEVIPNKKHTRYRIGSISKMFTATMIFQLIEQGQLSLDDTIEGYFPQLPNADKITVDNLLNHRTGVFNFTNDPEYMSYLTEPQSRQDLLAIISDYNPAFEPGSTASYSNSNYVLLSMILEDVSGKDYGDLLQKWIAKPLDLEETYVGSRIDVDKMEARSYAYGNNQWDVQPETDMSIPLGAGAVVSTATDLTKFIRALFKGKLVSRESLEQMQTLEDNYGRGMFMFPFYDKQAFGHNGGIDGFNSNLAYFPEEDIAVAILSNGMNYNMNNIAIAILSQVFDKDYTIPDFNVKAVDLNESELKKFEGTYGTDIAPMQIKVFMEEGQLKAQATGQSSFPLTPTSETSFEFNPANIKIEFNSETNDEGNYIKFNLKQMGQSIPFSRL